MHSDVLDFRVAGGSSSQDAVSKLEGKYCGLLSDTLADIKLMNLFCLEWVFEVVSFC